MDQSTDSRDNSTRIIRVKSFSGNSWYNISIDSRTCDCPNFQRMPGPCKHLNALGIYSDPKPFIAKSHPTFSQALSGLVKCLRLRRVEDAVYWLVYLDSLRQEKRARFRTARRLLIGSAEDGHSVNVMEAVVDNFSKLTKENTDLMHLVGEAVRICKVPNWWHPSTGGLDYIYHGMVGQRELWQWNGGRNAESVTTLLEDAIARQKKSQALAAVMAYEQAALGSTKQAEIVLGLAQKYKHEMAERLASIHLKAKSALSGDNNFLCQAVWMMAGGESPVADQIEPVFATEVMELIETAKERWKDPKPIPGWCCDGTHSAGNDVRFMGAWQHMYAVCKAFERYGRVDPNDEWLPGFQCYDGLIVQSAGQRQPEYLAIDCTESTH